MLVCNRKPPFARVKLAYWREYLPTGLKERVPHYAVQVDLGPEIVRRAREALALQCNTWMARDARWKFWLDDYPGEIEEGE